MTYEARLALAVKFNQRIKAGNEVTQLSVAKMLTAKEITPADMKSLIGIYDSYKVGVEYKTGQIFQYFGKLYRVIAPGKHTSQADWKPDTTPAVYDPINPVNIIALWEQRYGHNPYKPGDKVTWNGKTYECVLQTTYIPTDYAQAWKVV